MRVSDADRERTIEHLKYAYGEGRLTVDEFEERVAAALAGKTRSDLETLLEDLLMPMAGPPPPVPMARPRPGPPPLPWMLDRPPARPFEALRPGRERGWSAVAHWSGFCAPVVGPYLIRRTVGSRSKFVRANASSALNFQLTCLFSFVLTPILALFGNIAGGLLISAMFTAIAVFAILGGARAAGGDVMRYPISMRVVK
ncbi:DUF1707 and DUF4870 domain-containing protein [Embleya sp. AB8]|uniref:DUF1707 and DUF4870 domain-containing protein n=1 Tax=Embleya sp. AB8 TaxID=3156304 RepID=UPI003C74CEED